MRTVAVPLVGDAARRGEQDLRPQPGTPVNAFIADGQGLATIVDDDGPALSVGDQSVTEGRPARPCSFTVSLASPARLTTVDYATADVSAAPAATTSRPRHVTFAPGATSTTVRSTVNGDDALDGRTSTSRSSSRTPATRSATRAARGRSWTTTAGRQLLQRARARLGARAHLAALPGPAADQHRYVVRQYPRASYEVVGTPPRRPAAARLQRLSAAGTVAQASSGSGVGRSRSLRWFNTGAVRGCRAHRGDERGCGPAAGRRHLPQSVSTRRPARSRASTTRAAGHGAGAAEPGLDRRHRPGPPVDAARCSARQLLFSAPARGSVALNTATVPGPRARRVDHRRPQRSVRRADRQGGRAGAGTRLQLRHTCSSRSRGEAEAGRDACAPAVIRP